ncbi:restriction endonuclease [uncultured Phyllobacterium sp.]|uniref:restriction endonuclease n=1 Tax=uncultured Phyllobacterium sp. TaxID=253813 RepID=UPI0025839736|nr:restriction endonuclease [uncultured Phyllobacterium sp.]
MTELEKPATIVQAPLYPLYSDVAHAIRLLNGEPVQRVRDMISAIASQMGTPQNPADWSDPNTWIAQRLSGELQTLAKKIWEDSGEALNPRYLTGCYLFINRLKLLEQNAGVYRIGERGQQFLANDETILRELDAIEGIPKLLSLVAERSPCKRGDILPAWSDYLKAVSLFTTPKTFADTLRRRLVSIAERGLITREGNYYAITDAGLQWLKGFVSGPEAGKTATPSSKRTTVAEAAHAHNEEQLAAFRARLMQLEPAQFEHFVKELLDAMDYEDVRVTKVSGDKGVDVIARVQFGITEITEVVQVKRTENTITRPKVDELRGALPYFKAIRGTIISLGSFAKGAQEGALFIGAAPITLIDGKRLLDLCIKHEVGVKRRPVEIYEIDEAFFAEKFTREEVEESAPITDDNE